MMSRNWIGFFTVFILLTLQAGYGTCQDENDDGFKKNLEPGNEESQDDENMMDGDDDDDDEDDDDDDEDDDDDDEDDDDDDETDSTLSFSTCLDSGIIKNIECSSGENASDCFQETADDFAACISTVYNVKYWSGIRQILRNAPAQWFDDE